MEKETLKLEEIVGYLPYGLKLMLTRKEHEGIYTKYSINNFSDYPLSIEVSGKVTYGAMLSEIKPVLRPLSDLTKEIEINGENFMPSEELAIHLFDFHFVDYVVNKKETNGIPFWVIQKLYEWHFDIHNLIPRGLAINIDTLNKTK